MYKIISKINVAFLVVFLLYSCEMNENKVESAKEELKDAKEDLLQKQQKANQADEAHKAIDLKAHNDANEIEWDTFKKNVNTKIVENSKKIDELNGRVKKTGKTTDVIYKKM